MELEYNSITRPKAQTDSDWKSDATCFADSGQHRRYLEMRSDPYESRLRGLSNKVLMGLDHLSESRVMVV